MSQKFRHFAFNETHLCLPWRLRPEPLPATTKALIITSGDDYGRKLTFAWSDWSTVSGYFENLCEFPHWNNWFVYQIVSR